MEENRYSQEDKDKDGTAWCGAIGCSNSKQKKPHLSFHRFPSNPERCRQWVQNCRRQDLIGKSSSYLHDNVKLCIEHFEPTQYHAGTGRLKRDAVPTWFAVPNPPKPVTVLRPKTERQELVLPPRKKHKTGGLQPEWSGMDVIFEDPLAEKENTEPADQGPGDQGPADQGPADQGPADQGPADQGPGSRDPEAVLSPSTKPKNQNQLARALNKSRCLVRRLKEKVKRQESAKNDTKIKPTVEGILAATSLILPPATQSFLRLQLKLAGVKPNGRRYTDEELTQCLAIYYQGPRAYRQLRKWFVLPSPRVLRRRLELIQSKPGFQAAAISILGEKYAKTGCAQDKLVVLSFDEMSLNPKLTYLPGDDCVEGFENFGEMGTTSRQADHALVFMARGVTNRWKQPLGFFNSCGPTPACVMEHLLVSVIRKLRAAGMVVLATVCDMGTPNQQLYRMLGVTDSEPSFMVDGTAVTALHDVPHLFKCIRNGLYAHDVDADGQHLSWDYIKRFHLLDKDRPIRAAPRLTAAHLNLPPFKKMKVKLATQVLSRSTAAGMLMSERLRVKDFIICIGEHTKIIDAIGAKAHTCLNRAPMYNSVGLLPDEVVPTARALLRLNDAFDALNSSAPSGPCPSKRALSRRNEDRVTELLIDARSWVSRWTFDGGVKPDFVKGFRMTITGLLNIWAAQRESGLGFLLTRRFNQDGLENFFGVIRLVNGANDVPNCTQFRLAYRKVSANSILMPPSSANCEADGDNLLDMLTSRARRVDQPVCAARVTFTRPQPQVIEEVVMDVVAKNCLAYVAGYLARKVLEQHQCARCEMAMCRQERAAGSDSAILTALKSYTGVDEGEVGSLKQPTEAFELFVRDVYVTVQTQAPTILHEPVIMGRIMPCILATSVAADMRSALCGGGALEDAAARFVRLQLHVMCRRVEAARRDKGPNRKLLKVSVRAQRQGRVTVTQRP